MHTVNITAGDNFFAGKRETGSANTDVKQPFDDALSSGNNAWDVQLGRFEGVNFFISPAFGKDTMVENTLLMLMLLSANKVRGRAGDEWWTNLLSIQCE